MTTQEALDFVKSYNLWRRGDEDLDQPDPKEIGIALDVLCDSVEQKALRFQSSTMSNTPETDACVSSTRGESIFHLCKRLERERDEANEELHKRLSQYDALFDEADKIRKERDDAQAMVKRLLYTAHLSPESQEKHEVLDGAQNFLKDKRP